jgi:hypothetical protein
MILQLLEFYIGHPTEFPSLEERGILLQPGHEHYLSLSSQIFTAYGIKDLDPEDRQCFFPDEGNLDLYKKYTFQNCRFECGINLTEKLLGCTPWYLPQGSNSTICDPWTAIRFSKLLGGVHSNISNCQNCLPDCEMTETSVLLSNAKFR